MAKKFLICFLFFSGFCASSLEIDEKLTLRILNVSATKKTVLVNRGLEDGLVVGDHAKFFLTTGVVARGTVVKASPSRSIWSLYRLVDAEAIEKDKVIKIKISSPVKLTEDPSKMLEEEDRPESVAVVSNNNEVAQDNEELASLKKVSPKKSFRSAGKLEKNDWEIWGMISGSMLSGLVERTSPLQNIEMSGTFIDGTVGLEKYVGGQVGLLSHISVSAFLRMDNVLSSGADGESTGYEYGVGINYHFGSSAAVTNKLIWVAQANVGLAMPITLTDSTGNLSGKGTFMGAGVIAKYYMDNGLGVRAGVEYYTRNETYEISTSGSTGTWKNSLSGFRGSAGLSYRF